MRAGGQGGQGLAGLVGAPERKPSTLLAAESLSVTGGKSSRSDCPSARSTVESIANEEGSARNELVLASSVAAQQSGHALRLEGPPEATKARMTRGKAKTVGADESADQVRNPGTRRRGGAAVRVPPPGNFNWLSDSPPAEQTNLSLDAQALESTLPESAGPAGPSTETTETLAAEPVANSRQPRAKTGPTPAQGNRRRTSGESATAQHSSLTQRSSHSQRVAQQREQSTVDLTDEKATEIVVGHPNARNRREQKPNLSTPSGRRNPHRPVGQRRSVAGWTVYWDIQNVMPPSGSSGYLIVKRLTSLLQDYASGNIDSICVYAPIAEIRLDLRDALQANGCTIRDVDTGGRKECVDKAIITDMCMETAGNNPPYGCALISGDQDFSFALAQLRKRGFAVVVIGGAATSHFLRTSCDVMFSFRQDVLDRVNWNRKNPSGGGRGRRRRGNTRLVTQAQPTPGVLSNAVAETPMPMPVSHSIDKNLAFAVTAAGLLCAIVLVGCAYYYFVVPELTVPVKSRKNLSGWMGTTSLQRPVRHQNNPQSSTSIILAALCCGTLAFFEVTFYLRGRWRR